MSRSASGKRLRMNLCAGRIFKADSPIPTSVSRCPCGEAYFGSSATPRANGVSTRRRPNGAPVASPYPGPSRVLSSSTAAGKPPSAWRPGPITKTAISSSQRSPASP